MWMSSNVRTLLISRDEQNQLTIRDIDQSEISNLNLDTTQHETYNNFADPMLLALTNSLILNELLFIPIEEEKNKLTEYEFNNLETCSYITNCAICMENKKSNIKLKCNHIFCKGCIKKWLTERSNTCPNCRIEI